MKEGQPLSFVVKLVNAANPTKKAPAQFPITVSYQTLLITTGVGFFATANDFPVGFSESTVQTVEFRVGESERTISLATLQDAVAERDETMKVSIVKVEKDFGGKVELTLPTDRDGLDAIGTLLNDDTVITIQSVSQPEGDVAKDVTFTATIGLPVAFPVSFHYKTKNGTGNLADYVAADGTVTIPAGQTSATFVVQSKGDKIFEEDETFIVDITDAKDAVIQGASAAGAFSVTGTIQNDDAAPQLTVRSASSAEDACVNAGTASERSHSALTTVS